MSNHSIFYGVGDSTTVDLREVAAVRKSNNSRYDCVVITLKSGTEVETKNFSNKTEMNSEYTLLINALQKLQHTVPKTEQVEQVKDGLSHL